MLRQELDYPNNKIISILKAQWLIQANQLDFIDSGSFFGFIIHTQDKKYFLKIYNKIDNPDTPESQLLNNIGIALYRFHHEFSMHSISRCVAHQANNYAYESNKLIFIVHEYISGNHPFFILNEPEAQKLAQLFSQLHHIPITSFSQLPYEIFDISYTMQLHPWLDSQHIDFKKNEHAKSMLEKLQRYKPKVESKLLFIKNARDKFLKRQFSLVITHGDAHHHNILQDDQNLWLVDWDGLKIAPIERDLWHHENTMLIKFYNKLNPSFILNSELCDFYRTQRFFDDLIYYLEQIISNRAHSDQQKIKDANNFLTHWGWEYCL